MKNDHRTTLQSKSTSSLDKAFYQKFRIIYRNDESSIEGMPANDARPPIGGPGPRRTSFLFRGGYFRLLITINIFLKSK